MSYKLKTVSAMTKARLEDRIGSFEPRTGGTALRGDRHFFSLLVQGDNLTRGTRLNVEVDSPLADCITTYLVDHVPVRQPCYPGRHDADYIDNRPGLYPDLLRPFKSIFANYNLLSQLYVEIRTAKDLAPGSYPIRLVLSEDATGAPAGEITYTLEVLNATLPEQTLTVTHWFHYDCLANYYNVEVFSERHWEIVENYVRAFADRGSNYLLTPIFTPPLDTKVGGERLTVQLIDVTRRNGRYTFGFEKLRRFCEMCRRTGVRGLEIAHFFTQWGAKHAPKIMADDEGTYRRIFGWDTEAAGEEYITFLRTLIPQLKEKLDEYGFADRYFFHISDEPSAAHLEDYAKAKNAILDLISDHPVRDALSNVAFYEQGVVTAPIPSNDHIDSFLQAKVPDLWTYYCCSQGYEVSNRFIAMPGYRTRVLGAQLFKYDITGFLQWGYNFYNNQYSMEAINPFLSIEGDLFTPAGDNLMVYPGQDGFPIHSLHELLFEQALLDMRAMQAAAAKVGKDTVVAAIDAEGAVDFKNYPRHEDYLLTLRDTVNRLAAE